MPKFYRSSLLKFLHKPRCLREIIRHFEVPTELVDCHLQEAIRCGDVLFYSEQIPSESPNSNAKQLRLERFLFISRDSPLHARDLAAAICLPKTRSSATRNSVHHNVRSSVFSSRKLVFLHNLMAYLKPELRANKTQSSRVLQNISNKMKLARGNRSDRRLRWKTRGYPAEPKSLLYTEKICLFRALSNQPLPFLDIHKRFEVSKRIVKGFVKNGFFEEVWGPKNIGVKYKLTEKGVAYLKRLEKASHLEPQHQEKIFIRLKHRISS